MPFIGNDKTKAEIYKKIKAKDGQALQEQEQQEQEKLRAGSDKIEAERNDKIKAECEQLLQEKEWTRLRPSASKRCRSRSRLENQARGQIRLLFSLRSHSTQCKLVR